MRAKAAGDFLETAETQDAFEGKAEIWKADWKKGEVKTVAGDIRRTKKFRELKSSMEDSLRSRGLIEPVYTELLSRYLDLWCEYQDLTADINERGVTVMDEKRGMLVENRSLTIRHQTSNKMLDIYAALGFRDISAPRAGAKANSPTGMEDEL